METLLHDLRQAMRSLRKSPGFAAIAALTIALGIGTNVAIYTVVQGVLLSPLPYDDPGRLVHIINRSNTAPRLLVAGQDLLDIRDQVALLEAVGARGNSTYDVTLTGGGEPINVRAGTVSLNLFSLLGVEPVLGRNFLPEDAPPRPSAEAADTAAPPALGVIISHGLWQRAFGEDEDVVGKTIYLSGNLVVAIGVMPAGFRIVRSGERAVDEGADLWLPTPLEIFREFPRAGRGFIAFGRLRPGVTVEQAQDELDALYVRLQEDEPTYRNENIQVLVTGLRDEVVKEARPRLLVLAGAVGVLLLLACTNVANLLLVRGQGRVSETAVRAALGCGRIRLARQVLTESLVLAAVGGLLGTGLGWLGVRLLVVLRPVGLPRLDAISMDGGVLWFALAASLVATALFGSLPAIQVSRVSLTEALKDQTRGSSGGRKRILPGTIVVAEVALTMVLLSGAGLMVRTSLELQEIQPGFDPKNAVTVGVALFAAKYRPREARIAFVRELGDRIRGLPGVQAVGTSNLIPLGGGRFNGPYSWDEDSEAAWPAARASYRSVSGDYFKAIGTRLLLGRGFTEAEFAEESRSVIVDRKLADDTWPGEDPIGKSLIAGRWRAEVEVVGMVEHARHFSLDRDGYGTVYWPMGALPLAGSFRFVVRSSGDPTALVGPIRAEVRVMDPDIALHHVTTLEGLIDEQLAPTRFVLLLMGIFAAVAMILTAVGLYGVISYTVRQRTAEIGVRMALGAEAGSILKMVVGRGVGLTAFGLVVGVGGTLGLGRFVDALLYGVSATDPVTMLVVALLLGGIGLLASYVPAVRATHVDPVSALRVE